MMSVCQEHSFIQEKPNEMMDDDYFPLSLPFYVTHSFHSSFFTGYASTSTVILSIFLCLTIISLLQPMEVYVDDEAKLTLHGLQQYYLKLKDTEKNRKLFELLDVLEFNQVVIFVKSVQRCIALAQLLVEQNFPAIAIHRAMTQEERFVSYIYCLLDISNLPVFSIDCLDTNNSRISTRESWWPRISSDEEWI